MNIIMGNGIGMAASGPRTLDIRSSLDWQRRLLLLPRFLTRRALQQLQRAFRERVHLVPAALAQQIIEESTRPGRQQAWR